MSRLGHTAILFAARNPDVNVIVFVLEQGFDIDSTDSSGRSSLQLAAEWTNFKGYKLLSHRHANVVTLRVSVSSGWWR